MRKLVEESTKKKKEKKKQKEKDKSKKVMANSSSMGKPGAHNALTKTNSIISDSVEDSIASVVSGADLKMGTDGQHPVGGGKSMNMHHMQPGGANASLKPPKSKSVRGPKPAVASERARQTRQEQQQDGRRQEEVDDASTELGVRLGGRGQRQADVVRREETAVVGHQQVARSDRRTVQSKNVVVTGVFLLCCR
jgi:hypothetical protein